MDASDFYSVRPVRKRIERTMEVPGSKSITNRALLLACLARGKSVLTNVLFSDDSRSFMECLEALGYRLNVHENDKTVELFGGRPKDRAYINVGSAGTSARFLTAMLAACEGEYIIDASEQMKTRPMKPLAVALACLGCKIEYLEKDGFLPFKIYGKKLNGGEIIINTEQSSQFTSALLMTGCLHKNDLTIKPAGKETAKSYVDISLKMMEQFGVRANRTNEGAYIVKTGRAYAARTYKIEPDVSGACYFYAAAALTGGSVLVKDVFFTSMQGDVRFLDILKSIGCSVTETGDGILLKGPAGGVYEGINVDMNDCSDQVATLAALAPFASSPTIIRNIRHIKYQESNRIQAILTELTKMGIRCAETGDGIIIHPGTPEPSIVDTYGDHRIAMAFALVGLRAKGIKIADPSCTSKTFENYFTVFDQLYT
jgi:3-phosphoshikimate 1-carboxyvinyltransferase